MSGRIGRDVEITLFDAFRASLQRTFENYPYLFQHKKNRIAFSHRLASEMDRETGGRYLIDISLPVTNERTGITPDIIVRERDMRLVMALYIEEDYLSKAEKDEASRLHEETGAFTLALSILSEKEYVLLYRFAASFTDYLHLSKHDYSDSLLKRMEDQKPDEQLLLIPQPKKRRKKSKE